jgi:hypothetical protein
MFGDRQNSKYILLYKKEGERIMNICKKHNIKMITKEQTGYGWIEYCPECDKE